MQYFIDVKKNSGAEISKKKKFTFQKILFRIKCRSKYNVEEMNKL